MIGQALDEEKSLKHVAIIMDGNGRWAAKRSLPRMAGHRQGLEAVRRIVRAALEVDLRYLSLFGFSEDNWRRPPREVQHIMYLFESFLLGEVEELANQGVRLRLIGDRERLSVRCRELVADAERRTRFGRRMTLQIAISYSGRSEIAAACRAIAEKVEAGELAAREVDGDLVTRHLQTRDVPDPDLLVRTAAEVRLSNFMLWQIAYSELWFTETLWPDFGKQDLMAAIAAYGRRTRTYGGLSELDQATASTL
jgi:undecaprenyl diphosphate synthase